MKRMPKPKREVRLIVAADEPALFFSSVDAAEQYLEAIDVEDGVYPAAYGTQGEPYLIGVDAGRVVISRDEGAIAKPDELKELLLRYLRGVGTPGRPSDALADLVDRCAPHLTC